MAFTQEQLNTLNAAIAEGALIVWYGDKRIEYRSLDQMIKIRNMMIEEINAAANKTKPSRYFISSSKGT